MTTQPDKRETLDPQDWEEMRALAHKMVDDAIDYVQNVRDRPVWQAVPPEVVERLSAPAPQAPEGAQRAYQDFLDTILPYPMGNIHPRFWGWFMGNGTFVGALGEFLAAVMNANVGGGNHAAMLVEKQVIAWCGEMLGYPATTSGLLVSGASVANLVGLAVARNTLADVDVRREGLRNSKPMVFYASTEVHSCHQKALELMGLGSDALRKLPVNARYEVDVAAVARAIREDRAAGSLPLGVIGNAGTINTGAVDDLSALAELCEREGLWFHVDGAIGALLTLAPSLKHKVAGIERADSVALDLHKWMHVPFEAGCVLVRDEGAHRQAFTLTPEYLQHTARGLSGGATWFSDYGPQLTRGFRALKVWLAFKAHGTAVYGRLMEQNVAQAKALAARIDRQGELELLAPVDLNIVCFRFNPGGLSEGRLNALNQELLMRMHESGVAAPTYTTLGDRYCLRVAIVNHRSTEDDFRVFVEALLELGHQLLKEWQAA